TDVLLFLRDRDGRAGRRLRLLRDGLQGADVRAHRGGARPGPGGGGRGSGAGLTRRIRRATVAEPREPIRASRPAPKIARTVTTSLPERPATPATGPTMTTHRRFATSAATLLSLLAASAAAPAQSTVRASVDAAGGESNQWSGCTWLGESPAFSADDRWVAFESLASNLVS